MAAVDSAPLRPTSEERLQLLERSGLSENVSEFIRGSIVSGRIRPGTRLVEHQLASSLGISRVPVREALIQLERAGLVVSRPNGRYVLEISERDIAQLYEVRLVLERLAVGRAAQNITPERAAALRRTLAQMAEADARQDLAAHVQADFELHQLIWRQADNPHLLNALRTLAGPIYMFMANDPPGHDSRPDYWAHTVGVHEGLVESIAAGDEARAVASIEDHIADSVRRARSGFAAPGAIAPAASVR
jgi:DNA-binding GntR family transcriptional regulator